MKLNCAIGRFCNLLQRPEASVQYVALTIAPSYTALMTMLAVPLLLVSLAVLLS